MSTRTFWAKIVFLSNSFFLVLGSWLRYFWSSRQKLFSQFRQNCIQSILRNALIKIISFTKYWHVPPFFGIEWKIFWLHGEKLRHLCQIRTRLSQLHFQERDIFSSGIPKLISTCQRIISRKNIWYEKYASKRQPFLHFSEKTVGLPAIFVHQRYQNCGLCVTGTNWGKYCFERLYNTITFQIFNLDRFGLSTGILGGIVLFAFYVSIITFWGENLLMKKKYFEQSIIFGLWAKSVRTFGEKFWASFSEVNIGVHKNVFVKHISFMEELFSNLFQFLIGNFSGFRQKPSNTSGRLQKRKNVFFLLSDIEITFSKFWWNIFLRGCWNRFLRV